MNLNNSKLKMINSNLKMNNFNLNLISSKLKCVSSNLKSNGIIEYDGNNGRKELMVNSKFRFIANTRFGRSKQTWMC